jgi:hypothetical protein
MDRTINTPIAPATLALAEELLVATWTANAAEPYVAADYDAPYEALMALLRTAFGAHGDAVREATYDGLTVAQAVEHVKADVKAAAREYYEVAVDVQAEEDALCAFDALVEGWGDPADHLRTFAGATDHLDRHGMVLDLASEGPRAETMDDAAARFLTTAAFATA